MHKSRCVRESPRMSDPGSDRAHMMAHLLAGGRQTWRMMVFTASMLYTFIQKAYVSAMRASELGGRAKEPRCITIARQIGGIGVRDELQGGCKVGIARDARIVDQVGRDPFFGAVAQMAGNDLRVDDARVQSETTNTPLAPPREVTHPIPRSVELWVHATRICRAGERDDEQRRGGGEQRQPLPGW
jgi:hypothetical protein